MLLKCTKNLVIDNRALIMKHDIIKIVGSEEGDGVLYFDCEVMVSDWFPGIGVTLSINLIAEHFEYLEVTTMNNKVKYISEKELVDRGC